VAKTLKRTVYLDGVALAPGTELTDEQAERITNPKATEDLAIPGQDGTPVDGDEQQPAEQQPAEHRATARRNAPPKPANQ
jgi:hypothetical protein